MPSRPVDLIFPLKGIDETWAFGRQPEGTTPDCLNVIPFDSLESRARGGQRWGTSKYYSDLHNGANALQRMTSIALSAATSDTSITDTFTQGNGVLDDTNWYPLEYDGQAIKLKVSAILPRVAGNELIFDETDDLYCGAVHKVADSSVSPNYEVSIDVTWSLDETSATIRVGFWLRATTTFPANVNQFEWVYIRADRDFGPLYTFTVVVGDNLTQVAMTPGSDDYLDPTWWTTARTLKVVVTGNLFELYVGDTLLGSDTVTDLPANTAVGFWMDTFFSFISEVTVDNFVFESIASESSRDYQIIAVSDGDVYTGRPSESLTLATDGENVVSTTGRVGLQSAFAKVYACDGVNANYSVWTASTNTVATWTPSGGTLPVSGTTGARYIALYRGRIVLSGLITDPHNWFMSAAGDPLDWDYGATVTAIMAVAGNSTNAGKCPDIVTCLAPYSDDLMFIGGDHTLWLMRGDPADRGRIDNISYQTGISGPDAYTFDPNGIFYFFGSGTIWRMSSGSVPEPLSRNRMDTTFGAIDLTANTVHLAWDNVRRGLFIFVVPKVEGATTAYFWDQRTDGFWPISFPNAQGPTTVLAFDGDNPDDNALLLGGWDGYIRQIDSSATDDDGTAVSSYVLYPPIVSGGPLQNIRLTRTLAVLDTSSDDVILTAYAEDTPQKAIASSTVRFAKTLEAGRTTFLNRVAGNAIVLKLSNAVDETTWAIENLVVNIEPIGRTRKNQL